MNLEDGLRRALAREAAPGDFADKVLARAASQPPRALPAMRPRGALSSRSLMTMAACALLAVGATRIYIARATASEAQRATTQVRIALEIASEKLALVQRRIHGAQP
jgi:hypothetical protein